MGRTAVRPYFFLSTSIQAWHDFVGEAPQRQQRFLDRRRVHKNADLIDAEVGSALKLISDFFRATNGRQLQHEAVGDEMRCAIAAGVAIARLQFGHELLRVFQCLEDFLWRARQNVRCGR